MATAGFVRLMDDSALTGKYLDTVTVTVGGNTVHRQVVVLGDPDTGTVVHNMAAVNAALSETAVESLRTAACCFALDTAAAAGSQAVPLQVESTAQPNLRVTVQNAGNRLPSGHNAANAIHVQPSDGTNAFKAATATNQASSTSGLNAVQAASPGEWTVSHAPAVNTQATASKAAGGAGVRHVARAISASLCAGTTAPAAAQVSVRLRDGASGAGTILWEMTLCVQATAGVSVPVTIPVNIVGTANTAMTLEFSGAAGANTFESVSLSGYSTSG